MRLGMGLLAMLAAGTALAADPQPWQLNMTPGVTAISQEVYWLHNLILGICVVIGILVFGAMGYAMFAFRKSKGAVAAQFSHNAGEQFGIPLLVQIITVVIEASMQPKVAVQDSGAYESSGFEAGILGKCSQGWDRVVQDKAAIVAQFVNLWVGASQNRRMRWRGQGNLGDGLCKTHTPSRECVNFRR